MCVTRCSGLPSSLRCAGSASIGPARRAGWWPPVARRGEGPAGSCKRAAALALLCKYWAGGRPERGSCPLLCLPFPSGCLVSVNHPVKANSGGEGRCAPRLPRLPGPGDTQMAPEYSHQLGSPRTGSRQHKLRSSQTLVRIRQHCGAPRSSSLCRVRLVCWGWRHHQGTLQDTRAGI